MRTIIRSRVFGATLLALTLVLAACGDGSGGDATSTSSAGETPTSGGTVDGPTITVASFGFPESVILGEIYAQVLEANGYPVERNLNLGPREVIFPELESGGIDFLPEYLGSAISVGFGETASTDPAEALATLQELLGGMNVTALAPAPGEDKNVFVVTGDFASENGVSDVADLADLGEITLGGPPECEDRTTCYSGLVNVIGLDNLEFESIPEGAARVAALDSGDIQLALLFSTQPVIGEMGFVALEGTAEIIAPENIIPVVSNEVLDAYGDDFTQLIDSISAEITTEVLLDLNGRVELDGENPDDVAAAWLQEAGLLDG